MASPRRGPQNPRPCRLCGGAIGFLRQRRANGTWAEVPVDLRPVRGLDASGRDRELYRRHAITCPKAEEYRRRSIENAGASESDDDEGRPEGSLSLLRGCQRIPIVNDAGLPAGVVIACHRGRPARGGKFDEIRRGTG